MAKLLKILFGLLAVVLFLVVAAVVIVPMVVDPNDFRDDIAAQVKKHTGRDLTIGGEIGLSVFPWLGVELNQLSLSQPPAFGAEPFAEIKRAQVRAKLMPLLDKQLEVDTILLDGMRLRLIRNEQGTGNWEDLAQGGQDQPSEPQEAADEEGPAITGLTVGGIQVSDARVSWHDRQAAQQLTIENLDLETGKIMRDAPLDLDLSFVIDSQAPVFRGRVSLQGTATPTQNNSRLEIAPLELRLSEARTGDGLTAQATVTAQALLDMAAQKYRIDGLRLEALAEGDQLPGGKLEARLQADATVDMADGTLDLPGFELHAAGLNLTGHLQGRSLDTAPSFNGKLSLAEINLRQWLQQRGLSEPQTADPQTLQKLSLNTGIQANAQEAGLENLRIILDDSTIEGNGRILLKEVPGYRFALSLDRIDLDRYLPPAAADADQSTQPPSAGEETAAEGAPLFQPELIEQLRLLDADGSFKIGNLKVNNLTLKSAQIQLKAQNGDVAIKQSVGAFYQGQLAGALGLNVKGMTPRIDVNQRAQDIQAGPLLQDLTGQDRMTGTGNLNLDLSAAGDSVSALKQSLDGNLNFAFTDGAVKGINLGRILREAAARLKGQTLPADNEANETDFSELKASAVISDGVLRNDDLSAKSPLFRVTGKGTVDIAGNAIDYKIKPVLVGTLKGQGGKDLKELEGVPVPVHLTGALDKPDWRIDLAEALTAKQKQKLQKKVDEKLEEVAPGLKDALPGGLKGLFN